MVPDWLLSDPLAARLIRYGMDENDVCELVERAAILEHEGGKLRRDAERIAEELSAKDRTLRAFG
jgi:hypothetical protein